MNNKYKTTRNDKELTQIAQLCLTICEQCIRPHGVTQIDYDVALMADLIDQYAKQKIKQ